MAIDTNRASDGFIECWDEENDQPGIMAVWLPPGETAATLGLKTFIGLDEMFTSAVSEFDFADGETDEACP